MRLSDLEPGQSAIIVKVTGHGAFRKRIMEMGFVRGKRVSMVLNAPLQDPVKYNIMDYEVSLRRSEASMIQVVPENQAPLIEEREGGVVEENGTTEKHSVDHLVKRSKRRINVALVGNPNSGKSSLFNEASGSHQHVGNYGGVTVDAKKGAFNYKGYRIVIYDLPGTYALSAYSPEEVFVRSHLVEHSPDVVINVVAASNLERNLYLTTELLDMDCTMVMALNMYDELEQSGSELNYKKLGGMIGVPIVPTVSKTGKGIDKLFDKVIDVYEYKDPVVRHIHISHNPTVEQAIETLEDSINACGCVPEHFSARYMATKLLERDEEIELYLSKHRNYDEWVVLRDELESSVENKLGEDIETIVTDDKYGFISGALKETFTPSVKEQAKTTQVIDSFVTHKLFGFPIFLLFMWIMFEATFSLGAYPMEWIENGVAALGNWLGGVMSDGMLKDLLVDGVIGGVGGVIVFLPNILILYLCISFMEDSGYMARAAFIMDKLMHRIGLHGKSFIPLIMGFGCNVPAIMATRTIESRSSRIITILINPFMSCSARLPVYVLLIGTFFPNHGSLVMLSLYLFGIVMAVVTAKLLRKLWFKKDESPFVMELPPYRMPTLKSTLIHMWEKAAQYLRKMGGIILIASIAVWFLSYFPRHEMDATQPAEVVAVIDGPEGEVIEVRTGDVEQYEQSYLGRFGHWMLPVMEPLGFNWKQSVALVSGAAAKEIVVSTMGVLYTDTGDDPTAPLSQKLTTPNPETGKPDMTPLTAMSFLVFVLLYFPCLAALVAITKETGSWRWGAFSFFYNTLLAWLMAFLVYNIGLLFV